MRLHAKQHHAYNYFIRILLSAMRPDRLPTGCSTAVPNQYATSEGSRRPLPFLTSSYGALRMREIEGTLLNNSAIDAGLC